MPVGRRFKLFDGVVLMMRRPFKSREDRVFSNAHGALFTKQAKLLVSLFIHYINVYCLKICYSNGDVVNMCRRLASDSQQSGLYGTYFGLKRGTMTREERVTTYLGDETRISERIRASICGDAW